MLLAEDRKRQEDLKKAYEATIGHSVHKHDIPVRELKQREEEQDATLGLSGHLATIQKRDAAEKAKNEEERREMSKEKSHADKKAQIIPPWVQKEMEKLELAEQTSSLSEKEEIHADVIDSLRDHYKSTVDEGHGQFRSSIIALDREETRRAAMVFAENGTDGQDSEGESKELEPDSPL